MINGRLQSQNSLDIIYTYKIGSSVFLCSIEIHIFEDIYKFFSFYQCKSNIILRLQALRRVYVRVMKKRSRKYLQTLALKPQNQFISTVHGPYLWKSGYKFPRLFMVAFKLSCLRYIVCLVVYHTMSN